MLMFREQDIVKERHTHTHTHTHSHCDEHVLLRFLGSASVHACRFSPPLTLTEEQLQECADIIQQTMLALDNK